MEVTEDMIKALLSLDDKELSQKFAQIASALGMNERIAAANTGKFKSMLSGATPEDLNRLLSSLGEEKAKEILKGVGGEGA